MKTHIVIILIISSTLLFSCKNNEGNEEVCLTCQDSVLVRIIGNDTITINNVLTPRNYNMCDSFVFANGTYLEPYIANKYRDILRLCTENEDKLAREQGDSSCVCRINSDTEYNDIKGVNDFLYIKGIEKFPYNILKIYNLKDATPILIYRDWGNNYGDVFNAYILDTIHKPVKPYQYTGRFLYRLELYTDDTYTELIDVIEGGVTAIRAPQNCPTTGCVGRQPNDRLLH
jgi:hypothetical protein